MEKREIFNKVLETVKTYVKEPKRLETADMDTFILEDLKVNSARLVDIIIQFEDEFDIEIDDDDADQIRSIGDAVEYISGRLTSDQPLGRAV